MNRIADDVEVLITVGTVDAQRTLRIAMKLVIS